MNSLMMMKSVRGEVDQSLKDINDALEGKENDAMWTERNQEFLQKFQAEGVNTVTKLPSGVLFRIIETGSADGKQVKFSSDVMAKMSASDIDEYQANVVITPQLSMISPASVPSGIRDVLVLMREGDTWEAAIPYPLAGSDVRVGTVAIYSITIVEVDPEITDWKAWIYFQLGKRVPGIEVINGWQVLMFVVYLLLRIVLRTCCGVGRGVGGAKKERQRRKKEQ